MGKFWSWLYRPYIQDPVALSESYIKWAAILHTLYSLLLCIFTSVNNCTNAHTQRCSVQYLARCTWSAVVAVHPPVATPTLLSASGCVCKVASVFVALCWMKPMRDVSMSMNAPALVSVNSYKCNSYMYGC